ncbi:MAG TPA: MFS transporter [Candidatus Dormibacteraeota bacterium]|nr:MFS transporter [Candidatus Dormibacteraeota bacterium]
MSDSPALDRSYRALLAVPSLGRVLLGMQLARIGQQMLAIAMVLFTLRTYHSAPLAGLVTFAGIVPGLLVSPVAGALLDRHGRVRLVQLDFIVALASLALIGMLALADVLPAWLLLLIAAVSSLTAPLSSTGLRSLFPLVVPSHLWERVNAVDSNGYVVATIVGPPIAASLVGLVGGAPTLLLVAALYGLAAVVLIGSPDPQTETASTGRILVDAWQGLRYTWSNRTLRGLAGAVSVLNLAWGMTTIVIPLIVLERLGLPDSVVGRVYAIQGRFGMVAAFAAGRIDSRGRERPMFVWPMVATAASLPLLLIPGSGILPLAVFAAITGFVNGPMDIALFTLRQRRTDPAWMGRAFAVSMNLNFAGFPVGSAIAGAIAERSIDAAVIAGIAAVVIATVIAVRAIPFEVSPDEGLASVGAARRPADPTSDTRPSGDAAGRAGGSHEGLVDQRTEDLVAAGER